MLSFLFDIENFKYTSAGLGNTTIWHAIELYQVFYTYEYIRIYSIMSFYHD